ncbi:hypothetical protein [Amycolatopsis sp. cmx-4-54]|uniref:hypothetical protein n=1 Tax=Amycolatopsis sp. cmx-4-54 TaxID=2790936 RepID=UPI00397E6DE2
MSTVPVSLAHLVAIRGRVLDVLGELDLLLGPHDAMNGPSPAVPPLVTAVLESTGSSWIGGFVPLESILWRAEELGLSHGTKAALVTDLAARFPDLPAPAPATTHRVGGRGTGFPAVEAFAAVNA